MASSTSHRIVGQSPPRREGAAKVTGRALYVDDVCVPGCLHGRTIRSTIAKGRIIDIRFGPGVPWDEITVATAADLPVNLVPLIAQDQPALADRQINHKHEPILLLAHADPGVLEDAARAITIEYEQDTDAAFDVDTGPVQTEYCIEDGDPDAAIVSSDIVLEATYHTGAQEHLYIEPNGFIAWWEGDTVRVRGSHQCPYYVHRSLKTAFKLERDDQADVLQDTTGGAFGGKEDFPSVVAIHAALLARKSGRPVRLIYNRSEDMACSTKRHPSRSRVRIGCTKDGLLTALDFDFKVDAGAYMTLSPVVLSRGVLHACGPYRWPAARIHGTSHRTNSPPYGAFRGFGAPQSLFAIESAMNALADKAGISPVELRRRNFLHKGDRLPTGQVLDAEPMMDALLDRALEMADYDQRIKECRDTPGKGIGISTFLHGTGFTGSGEVYLASVVHLATRGDGKVEIRVSSTEMGQGTETILSQIAAEGLGVELDDIVFVQPRTTIVPNSGPTVASRTCSVVGRLIERAAMDIKRRLNGMSITDHFARHGETIVATTYEPPPGLKWDDETYRGSAYGAYSWGVNIAEVTVDPITAHPKVENLWAVFDIGTVVNPVMAWGQLEGGIAQGVGWATCENVVLREGAMANTQMTNYVIATTADAPSIHVECIENPYEYGAFGAKGAGELPMDGPAPAILGAVSMALRRPLNKIPLTPEELIRD
jgi:CO/xanthine dehydrogenase Mo-binding subunit